MSQNVPNPFFRDESHIADRCIWRYANGKSICSIGKITQINTSPVSVNVQPLVNYFDGLAGYTEYPILQYIPIIQMQTTAYSINTPVNIGDTGILLWFDREVYTTLLAGASATNSPSSGNLRDINACVFLPILPSFTLANSLQSTGVDIISANISLLTQLTNLLSQLLSLLSDMNTFLAAIVTAGASYAGSPSMPVVGAYPIALTAASQAFEMLITNITQQITDINMNLTTFQGAQK